MRIALGPAPRPAYFTLFSDGRFGPGGGLAGGGSAGGSMVARDGKPGVGLRVNAVPLRAVVAALPARRGPRDDGAGASPLAPSAGSLDVVASVGIGNAMPWPFSRA